MMDKGLALQAAASSSTTSPDPHRPPPSSHGLSRPPSTSSDLLRSPLRLQDVLSALHSHVVCFEPKDRMAHAMLVASLADLEHRLSLGTNDKMQLAGIVGLFQTSRPQLISAT